jgi:hypothetical protein
VVVVAVISFVINSVFIKAIDENTKSGIVKASACQHLECLFEFRPCPGILCACMSFYPPFICYLRCKDSANKIFPLRQDLVKKRPQQTFS